MREHIFRDDGDGGPVPLFVFDAGYDSAQLTLDLAEARVAVLVRLRADRCFYADPPPAARSPKGGRPRRHGAKFNFADPATWPTPTATLVDHDDQYGSVTVAAWSGLHPKQQRHPGHGTRGPRPIVRGTIIRVQVQRVPARTRPPKVLWLWWAGPGDAWTWTSPGGPTCAGSTWSTPSASASRPSAGPRPRPRHPEQADRWTWLVLAAYTQLRLARQVAGDQRLPWERPRPPAAAVTAIGCGAGFRGCCAHWARRRPRRNPPGAPQAGPRAAAPGLPPATQRSRSQPPSPGRSRPRPRRPPDRPSPPSTPADLGRRPAQPARRVKSQAKSASLTRRGRISRQRLPEHRDALIGIAWGLSQHCLSFQERDQELRTRGMRPTQARVALARHACRLCHALLRAQQPFDEARSGQGAGARRGGQEPAGSGDRLGALFLRSAARRGSGPRLVVKPLVSGSHSGENPESA